MRRVSRFVRPAWISEPVPLAAAFAAAGVSILAIVLIAYLVPHVRSADSKLGGGITQAAPCREGIQVFGDPLGLDQPECVKQATYLTRSCARHPHCLRPFLKALIAGLQKGDTRGVTRDGGHREAGSRAQQQQDASGGDSLEPSIVFGGGDGEVGHGHGGGGQGTTTTTTTGDPGGSDGDTGSGDGVKPVPPGNPLDPLMPLLDPLLNPGGNLGGNLP